MMVTDLSSPLRKLSRCLTDDDMPLSDGHGQLDSSRPLAPSSATRDPLEGGQRVQPARLDDVSDPVSASRGVSRANAAKSDVPGVVQPSRTSPALHDRSQDPSATASQPNQRNLQSQMLREEEPRELQRQWDSLGPNATDRACDSVDAEPSNAEAARRRRELKLRVDSEGSEDDVDDLRSSRSDRLVPAYSKRQGHHGARSMRAGGKLKWGEDFWRGKPAQEAVPRGFTFKGYLAQPMAAHPVGVPSDPPSEREAAQARPFNVQVQVFRRVLQVMRRVRIPVIHPFSRFRRDVNLIIALCIIYNVWEVFYQVAFNLRAQGAWQIVDACLSAIFLTDVFLGFKTGYVTKEKHVVMDDGMKVLKPQQIVMDQRKVVWHYLRTWFALDLLSSLPFDLLTSLASDSPAGFWISAAFRLLKLFRVHRLGVAAKQLRSASSDTNYMDFAILLFQICMLCHIGACIFVLIGRLELPSETWLAATYWSQDGVAQTLESAPTGVVYVAAIYWSMVTFAGVGYGDIHPMDTLAERLFATVYILLTAIMLGYTIGELSSMVYARRMQRESMRQRMLTLHRFIERERLPEWLANRMMAYLMRQWQASVNSKFEELELMQSLTDDLRTDLFVHWWTQHVPASPFFPHEQQCLASLQRVLVPRAVAAGDVVVREGEVSRHLYVVRSGTLEMSWALQGVDTLVETAATLPGKPMLGTEGMKLARAVSMRRCQVRSMQRQASCSSHGSPMAPPLNSTPAAAAACTPKPMHTPHGKSSGNGIEYAGDVHGADASPAQARAGEPHHADDGDSLTMVGCSPCVRRTRVYDSSLCTIESSSLEHSDSRGSGDGSPLPGDSIEPLREGAGEGCGEGAGPRGVNGAVPRVHSAAASHESYGSVRHESHLLGQAAFESRTVGVGHVIGLDGLSEVLELQTGEPSWIEQRVPFLFMEGTFQVSTCCGSQQWRAAMVTSVSASMMIDAASHSHSHTYPHSHSHSNSHSYPHSHSHSNEHANRAPTRSDRPWRKSASHRNADHDAATATYAAQRRQSRLDFQTERLGSPAEQRVEGGSLNQRMMEGRGDAMDHSSEPRLDTSGSCSSPSSLDVLPVSPLPASALPVSPFDVLHLPVPDGGERPDGDGTSRSGVSGGRGGAEGEPLPGGKPLFGQRRLRARLWRSAKELRDDDPGDDVALSFADDAPPAPAPLKVRSPFQWVMKSASFGVFAPGGGDDGSSSCNSSNSGGSTRRSGGKEGATRVALEEYMNVPMQLRPGHSSESEPPNAEQMGARRWWRGGPCVVAFKAALAAAMRVRIPIVHPYSRFRRDVNLIVGACIAYNLWEVLYMVAFDLRATGAWLILDSCLSLVYLADVLLGFKTGYLTREKHVMGEGGVKMMLPQQIVMDQRRIVWHYLRTWFVVDVLSSLPIDLIISSALAQSSVGFWLSAVSPPPTPPSSYPRSPPSVSPSPPSPSPPIPSRSLPSSFSTCFFEYRTPFSHLLPSPSACPMLCSSLPPTHLLLVLPPYFPLPTPSTLPSPSPPPTRPLLPPCCQPGVAAAEAAAAEAVGAGDAAAEAVRAGGALHGDDHSRAAGGWWEGWAYHCPREHQLIPHITHTFHAPTPLASLPCPSRSHPPPSTPSPPKSILFPLRSTLFHPLRAWQICMVCHVGACAFALIGRLETAPESWLAAFNWSNGGSQETLESAPHGVVYAAAYYWAMVTFASVGYGDIHPVDTLAERLFATAYILLTSILLGYAIGQISSLIYSSRARRESVRQRCSTLHRFIEKEEIPDWLANRMVFSALRSALCALCSLLSALRSPLCALRSVLSALCSLLSALCSLLSALCSVLSALCSLLSALCSLLSALCSLLSALCSVLCALCSVLCALCSVLSALCSLLCALCSLLSALCSLLCALCSRHVPSSPMLPHNHTFLAHLFPCMIVRHVAPADVIASEGEFTRHLYIVRSGTLNVTRLKDGPPPALALTHATAEVAGCEADVDGCAVEGKGGVGEVQLPAEHGGPAGGRRSGSIAALPVGGPLGGSLGGLLGTAGAGVAGMGVMQRRAMGRSLAVQEAVPAVVGGTVEYEKDCVGEGHVAGVEGLKAALEMRQGEEEWSSQRVSVFCMAASFQAKTECEVYLLLLDDLFDALESFPELLTAMRTALGLPLAPDEYLARPRLMTSHRSFKGLQRNKSQLRPTPFRADSSSSKTLSFGKGRVMRVSSSSMLQSFQG
ncbi:unnamed protein product [Closterium sp. NIES-53]